MKSVRKLILAALVLACVSFPQRALAQRFTSSGSSQPAPVADTARNRNGELAYKALKAGNLQDARGFLDDANPASPYALFVRAALTQDGVTAADLYKEIVAENEGMPIAREALIQLYRYHYAAGQYAAAHRDYIELQKFLLPPPVPDPLGLTDSLQAVPAFQPTQPSPSQPPLSQLSPAQPPLSQPSVEVSEAEPTIYLVQVGVFTTPDNARRFIQNLKVYGVNGKLFTKDIGGRELYGVSAGSFSDKEAAEDMARNLKSRSIQCIVVEK